MVAIEMDTVRTIAIAATGILVILAVIAGVFLKSVAQKAAIVSILGLLALLVWTQRSALDNCAEVLRLSFTLDGDSTCSFLGRQVSVRPDRS